jgi:ketosteroid isomerase-like protein
MSQEDIEILGAFYEAFNDRDFDDALQHLDRAVEFDPGVRAPDRDSKLLGHQGWKEFIRVDVEAWEAVTAEPLERIETEDGRILSIDLWRLRGREGIEIERELPTLYTFRDGLIVRIDGFTEKAEALETLGLSE